MCLAVPSKIIEINGDMGIIDVYGVKREVSLHMIEAPRVGEYVIVHAGFAINKIDQIEAQETLKILKEAAELVQ